MMAYWLKGKKTWNFIKQWKMVITHTWILDQKVKVKYLLIKVPMTYSNNWYLSLSLKAVSITMWATQILEQSVWDSMMVRFHRLLREEATLRETWVWDHADKIIATMTKHRMVKNQVTLPLTMTLRAKDIAWSLIQISKDRFPRKINSAKSITEGAPRSSKKTFLAFTTAEKNMLPMLQEICIWGKSIMRSLKLNATRKQETL